MAYRGHTREESFQDSLSRLFPESHRGVDMVVGGNFTRSMTIQVTEDCNLRCTYCYQHDKTPLTMTSETGRKFIDLILASDERTSYYIKSREATGGIFDFIGGEPFLAIDLMDELTDYAIYQMAKLDHPWMFRHRFSACTNGVLYFTPKVQEYLKKHMGHLSLTITIDGNKEIHDSCRVDKNGNGSYDRAIAAAKDWRSRISKDSVNAHRSTKITIAPGNIDNISRAVIEFINDNYKQININCVYENVWNVDYAKRLYTELKTIADYILDSDIEDPGFISILDQPAGGKYPTERTWCGGNGLMIGVDPRGDIYPCLRYMPSSVGSNVTPYIIGNVEHGIGITDIEKKRIDDLRGITRTTQSADHPECIDCPIGQGCSDCAAYSYEVTGKIGSRVTYICIMHKARVLAVSYYKNKMHLKYGKTPAVPLTVPEEWALEIISSDEYNMLKDLADQASRR